MSAGLSAAWLARRRHYWADAHARGLAGVSVLPSDLLALLDALAAAEERARALECEVVKLRGRAAQAEGRLEGAYLAGVEAAAKWLEWKGHHANLVEAIRALTPPAAAVATSVTCEVRLPVSGRDTSRCDLGTFGCHVQHKPAAAEPREPEWSGCPFCNEPVGTPHRTGCRHPENAKPRGEEDK